MRSMILAAVIVIATIAALTYPAAPAPEAATYILIRTTVSGNVYADDYDLSYSDCVTLRDFNNEYPAGFIFTCERAS